MNKLKTSALISVTSYPSFLIILLALLGLKGNVVPDSNARESVFVASVYDKINHTRMQE